MQAIIIRIFLVHKMTLLSYILLLSLFFMSFCPTNNIFLCPTGHKAEQKTWYTCSFLPSPSLQNQNLNHLLNLLQLTIRTFFQHSPDRAHPIRIFLRLPYLPTEIQMISRHLKQLTDPDHMLRHTHGFALFDV